MCLCPVSMAIIVKQLMKICEQKQKSWWKKSSTKVIYTSFALQNFSCFFTKVALIWHKNRYETVTKTGTVFTKGFTAENCDFLSKKSQSKFSSWGLLVFYTEESKQIFALVGLLLLQLSVSTVSKFLKFMLNKMTIWLLDLEEFDCPDCFRPWTMLMILEMQNQKVT